MTNASPSWMLSDFLPRLDRWADQEQPLDELRLEATAWILSRASDPFSGAQRVEGFADYWQAVVPNSEHFDNYAERSCVVCLFWIDVASRSVRCDSFASLSLPI